MGGTAAAVLTLVRVVPSVTIRQLRFSVHTDEDGSLWADSADLPGCFASGRSMDELLEAVREAVEFSLDLPAAHAVAVTPDTIDVYMRDS